MIRNGFAETEKDGARRNHKNATRIIVVQIPHPEYNTEHLEDVKGIQDFVDKDLEYRLLGHIDLTVAKLHALQVSQSLIANTIWVGVNPSELIVRKFATELNRYKLFPGWLPLKVYEPVGEEDCKSLDCRVRSLCLGKQLVAALDEILNLHNLDVAIATLDIDVSRCQYVCRTLVEPIPLHRHTPVEEDRPDEE